MELGLKRTVENKGLTRGRKIETKQKYPFPEQRIILELEPNHKLSPLHKLWKLIQNANTDWKLGFSINLYLACFIPSSTVIVAIIFS
jgi:hypothetical protein